MWNPRILVIVALAGPGVGTGSLATEAEFTKPVTIKLRLCGASAPKALIHEEARESWSDCTDPISDVPVHLKAGDVRTLPVATNSDGIAIVGPVEGAGVTIRIMIESTTHVCMNFDLDGEVVRAGETLILNYVTPRPTPSERDAVNERIAAATVPVKQVAALDEIPGIDTPVQLQFEYATLSMVMGMVGKLVPFTVDFKGNVGDLGVTAVLEPQSARQALVYLATEYDLSYEVSEKGHLVVSKRQRE